jgi:xylulokinase
VADAVGLDIGSTNVKAVLLDEHLEQVAVASRPLTWTRTGAVAEQDPRALWAAVVDVLADLGRAATGGGGRSGLERVGTVGLCGQYSSIVPVDARVRPVGPLRLYLDTRGTAHCLAIVGRDPDAFATWLERHPVPPVGGGLALGHLLAFQLDEPAVHAVTAAYLEPVDFVSASLTGRITATQGSVFAGQLVDNRVLGATAYDADLVRRAGVDASRLPPLVAPDAEVGPVRAEVAAATGLPATAIVRAGTTDTQAAALATGVAGAAGGFVAPPGRLGVAIGTTAVVLAATDRLAVDLEHEVLSMPGVSRDRWLVWAENGLAGRAVEAVLDRLVHPDDPLGRHRPADGDLFDGFDGALTASKPGAGGVLFLPWLSGSLAPQADPAVRGGFVGLSLDSRRVDLVRAAAEGVAHNLRWLLAPVETFVGERCEEVVLVGGASRSGPWCQIVADVLARPVRTVADAGHAGARAVAAWGADPTGSAATEPARGPSTGNRWGERYDPDAGTDAVHRAAHRRFVAAFDALRPLGFGATAG